MIRRSRNSGRRFNSEHDLPEFAVQSDGLSKSFQEANRNLEVLKGLNLSIRTGEIVAIMGPSGAGKSTLLHVLGLMESMSSGVLTLLGWDVAGLSDQEKDLLRNRYIGFMFQFHYLLPELTVLDNVLLPLRIAGKSGAEILDQSKELLAAVGLSERLDHFPSEISGGEQQRAALARAMVHLPKILICDEPTGNLDLERGEEVRELIWRVARAHSTTVLIATHNPEIAATADRTISIVNGQIQTDVYHNKTKIRSSKEVQS